jgi:hypothetical protein
MNTNHHLSKPVMIGKINSSGPSNVIWQSINPVRADAWIGTYPDSANRTADWTFPWVCGDAPSRDVQGMVKDVADLVRKPRSMDVDQFALAHDRGPQGRR